MRWGVIGTGGIAQTFATAMEHVPGSSIVAVSSRQQATADAFAAAHGIARPYGNDAALVEDAEVEAVYVATPHHRHHDDTIRALEAGKHVLCEKPLALNAAQADAMATAARRHDRFLMEAIWSRFLPGYDALRTVLAAGEIGEVLHVDASFGFRRPIDPAHRLFDLALGGGALLDLGLYPVQLAHMVLGPPTSVTAHGRIGATGVDEHIVVTMGFEGGALAVAQAAIRTPLASTARIAGTEGTILLPQYMHAPMYVDVEVGGTTRRIDTPLDGGSLRHEIAEVESCIARGARESEVLPLAESCAIAATLDRARAAIGLRYPGE